MQKKTDRSCPLRSVVSASKPVSRVLSFKTAIYLDAPLPVRSSRLPGTAGPAYVSLHGVAPDRVYSDGRLARHRVSSYLAFPPLPLRHKLPITRFTPRGKARSFRCASSPHESKCFRGGPIRGEPRRYISVALFLGSPPAGVTRYPCPMEPGLSSPAGLSPRRRGCPACLPDYFTLSLQDCQIKSGQCLHFLFRWDIIN